MRICQARSICRLIKLRSAAPKLLPDKNAEIVVYCASPT